VWAFSIAVDGANKSGMDFLDVRVRFVYKATLYNLHLVAIPFHVQHTGLNMFEHLSKVLDVLCPDWKHRLIGVTTDGASNMTGKNIGLVTRIQNVVLEDSDFYRVWCGAHQLDLVVKKAVNNLYDSSFVTTLDNLVGHLRAHKILRVDTGGLCPRVVDTRWISMKTTLRWIVHCEQTVLLHLRETPGSPLPPK